MADVAATQKKLTPMAAARERSLVTRFLLSPYAMCAPDVVRAPFIDYKSSWRTKYIALRLSQIF